MKSSVFYLAQMRRVLPTALSPTRTHLTSSWRLCSSSVIVCNVEIGDQKRKKRISIKKRNKSLFLHKLFFWIGLSFLISCSCCCCFLVLGLKERRRWRKTLFYCSRFFTFSFTLVLSRFEETVLEFCQKTHNRARRCWKRGNW